MNPSFDSDVPAAGSRQAQQSSHLLMLYTNKLKLDALTYEIDCLSHLFPGNNHAAALSAFHIKEAKLVNIRDPQRQATLKSTRGFISDDHRRLQNQVT